MTGMDPYASAGVDEEREQDVFATAMRPWLARTAVRSPLVTSITGLASGYFATLMHVPPGPPIALTTDGVGTKILLAREADRWEPVGIDCVANNVNDVICTGAVPLALLDYIATDRIDARVLEAIARGLYRGADEAGIAIPGGEIAQIGAMLADSAGGGPMLDLVGTAVGAIPDGRRPVDGSAVRPGDVVLALPSSGLHSNGYSLARRALGLRTRELANALMNEKQRGEFTRDLECNFAISLPGVARFRVNVFMQQQNVGMVIRTIANEIPDFAKLGLERRNQTST